MINENLWFLFELAVNALQSCTITVFLWKSLNSKHSVKVSRIGAFLCFICLWISVDLFNQITFFEGAAIFIYVIVLFLFSTLYFNDDIFKKLLISLLPINASAIGSVVSTNVMSLLFEKDTIYLLSQDSVFRIMTVALSNAILFLLLWILYRIFHRRAVGLGRTEYTFMLTQLCTAIITFMFLFFAIFNSTSNHVNLYITIALIGLVTINLIAFYLIARLSEQHQLELENTFFKQQQEHYVRSVNDMKQNYEAVQKIRHDFKNSLYVIRGLNEKGDREKIEQYIATFLDQNRNSVILVRTNCTYIDVLLSAKISEATEHNIDVKLITALNLPPDEYIDLCNLLGNLFDNAIAACLKVQTDRKLLLDIIQKDNEINICMKNTIVDSVLTVNPDLLSEKEDKQNHGYGTRIIRDIAKKHHGFADYYEEDGLFCCNIVMYLP